MADNVTLNPGNGGPVAASDDIGGVHYQRVKVTLGADGVSDGDVSSSNPMPVAVAGVATAANQATANAALANIDADIGALNAAAAPADGTGDYSVIAALKRVLLNGAAILARLPALVSGRIPVDGSGVTQPVSGSVSVSNFPATQPVSGTVTATGPLTDTQLRALAVPVSVSGVATSALQTTGNTSLSSIDTRLARTAAGTAASDALPMQGVTGGVPVQIREMSLQIPTTAATSAFAVGATSVQSAILSAGDAVLTLTCDARVIRGASPTATSTSMLLTAGCYRITGIAASDRIAVLGEGATGVCTIQQGA